MVPFNEGYEKLNPFVGSSKLNRAPNKCTVFSLHAIIFITISGCGIYTDKCNGICYEFPGTHNTFVVKYRLKLGSLELHAETKGSFMALKLAALFVK